MEAGSPASRLRVVGEESAAGWEVLYRAHVVPIYRYVFARCGNRSDAEDITAAVFLRALPRLRPAASDGEARAYLRATARTHPPEHRAPPHWRDPAACAPDLAPAPPPAARHPG